MKRVITGWTLVFVGLCIALINLRADTDNAKELNARLMGTWRLASMKINGEKNDLPQTSITYKHITPVGFVWLSHEKETGKVFRAAGGTYTLHGDTYVETIEYGMGDDFEAIKRTKPSFTCKVVGDSWFHTGKLANDTTIEEVWERVKPAEKTKAK